MDLRGKVFRSPVTQGIAVLLLSAIAIASAKLALQAQFDLAMVESVEAVRSAHAQARKVAAESGAVVRMQVAASDGYVRVWREGSHGRQFEELFDLQAPRRAWMESDVATICFDGRGRPLLAQGCEEQGGAIVVGTPMGSETWLTLTPDGQLLWAGSTIGG